MNHSDSQNLLRSKPAKKCQEKKAENFEVKKGAAK
jgi:hypothetical protein